MTLADHLTFKHLCYCSYQMGMKIVPIKCIINKALGLVPEINEGSISKMSPTLLL